MTSDDAPYYWGDNVKLRTVHDEILVALLRIEKQLALLVGYEKMRRVEHTGEPYA